MNGNRSPDLRGEPQPPRPRTGRCSLARTASCGVGAGARAFPPPLEAVLPVRDAPRSEITLKISLLGCFGATEGSKTGWRCSAGRGRGGKYVGDTSRDLGRGREVSRRYLAGPPEGSGRKSEMLRGASSGVRSGGEMVRGVRVGRGVGAGWSVVRRGRCGTVATTDSRFQTLQTRVDHRRWVLVAYLK